MRFRLLILALLPFAAGVSAETPPEVWWSFRPLKSPAVPAIAGDWVRNPIDAFVLAKLREQ